MGTRVLVEVVDDVASLEPLMTAWDELAVESAAPMSSPYWVVPLWRHRATQGAALHVLCVRDGAELVGVAPFALTPDVGGVRTLRMIGSEIANQIRVVARPDRAAEVVDALSSHLFAGSHGRHPFRLDGVEVDDDLTNRLLARVETEATMLVDAEIPAPFVTVTNETFDQWLKSRSSNFRQQTRRNRRRLEKAGVTFRSTSEDRIEEDLRAFYELHYRRWDRKGGSDVLDAEVERALLDAARHLVPRGRMQLWIAETEQQTIGAQLFLLAGTEMSYWQGGFHEEWAQLQPGMQTIIIAMEHAWSSGITRFDLGGGAQSYKYRLADSDRLLRWSTIFPLGYGYLRARARTLPHQVKKEVARRLPPEVVAALKRHLPRAS